MTDADRILTVSRRAEGIDAALRPETRDAFVRQNTARDSLQTFVETAK